MQPLSYTSKRDMIARYQINDIPNYNTVQTHIFPQVLLPTTLTA